MESDANEQVRSPRPVGIVPHTHWDREWYAPFQAYRLRLVHVVDDLLDLLERDPYVRAVPARRPDRGGRRLPRGPTRRRRAHRRRWSTRAASRSARGWSSWTSSWCRARPSCATSSVASSAPASSVARCRSATSPTCSVTSRSCRRSSASPGSTTRWCGGVCRRPSTRTAFWWEAPDGSRVRAEYLYGSYSNGRELPADPEALVARARDYELELGPVALAGGALLLMNGSDHLPPQPELGHTVAAANAAQRDYAFSITSLPEYLAGQPSEGLPTWRGELRSGARANVLMGVASNRVDVHQAAAAAERAIERRAEPLSALVLDASAYPAALLDIAWRNLVLEQRARFLLRLQRRRGRRGGAGALSGSAPHRRRAHARRPRRARPAGGRAARLGRGREPHCRPLAEPSSPNCSPATVRRTSSTPTARARRGNWSARTPARGSRPSSPAGRSGG